MIATAIIASSVNAETENANITKGLNTEILGELEGLRFEKIGDIKLITKFHTLHFHINISDVVVIINNASEYLELVEKHYKTDEFLVENLEKLRTNLELRSVELADILYGLVQKTPINVLKRSKRGLFDSLSLEHGEQIKKDLDVLTKTVNDLIDSNNGLKAYSTNLTIRYNKTIEELGKRNSVAIINKLHDEAEMKIKAIINLLTQERLSGEIVTLREFEKSLRNIEANLTNDEELPYTKVIDYFYNIPAAHKVEGNIIKLEMNVPIIENALRELYRIIELPARNGDHLIITGVEWKYAARNSNETFMLNELDHCFHPSKSLYYCELQSTLKDNSAEDCIVSALQNHKLDAKLCNSVMVKYPNLIFIHLNNGQYFYYTPRNETLKITCRFSDDIHTLIENTIGILELEPGCKATSKEQTLIKTVKYEEAPFIKSRILNITFDLDKVRENIRLYNTPLIDHFLIESINAFKDMAIPPKEIQKIENLHFGSTFGKSTPLDILIIVLFTVVAVFLMNRVYLWFTANFERKDNQKKGKKKINIDPETQQGIMKILQKA